MSHRRLIVFLACAVIAAVLAAAAVVLPAFAETSGDPPRSPLITGTSIELEHDWRRFEGAAIADGLARWYSWAAQLPVPTPPAPVVPRRPGAPHRGYATARECVSMVEHAGSYDRSSNPTHFGRYQFSRPAWESFGGNPDTWGTATPAEQDAVFDTAWSQGPAVQLQQWLRWDGCGPPD